MGIAENIKRLREEHGLTQDELARIAGVSPKAVSTWETGRYEPRMGPIQRLADYFGVRKSDIIEDFRLSSTQNLIPLPKTKKVPLLGDIACGVPILAVENIDAYVDMPDEIHANFALRCKGDSMVNARIYDGDIVYIREQIDVENGEIAAVQIMENECEVTLKRVKKGNGKIILWPENSDYDPLIFSKDEINNLRILGKAVAFLSTIR